MGGQGQGLRQGSSTDQHGSGQGQGPGKGALQCTPLHATNAITSIPSWTICVCVHVSGGQRVHVQRPCLLNILGVEATTALHTFTPDKAIQPHQPSAICVLTTFNPTFCFLLLRSPHLFRPLHPTATCCSSASAERWLFITQGQATRPRVGRLLAFRRDSPPPQ